MMHPPIPDPNDFGEPLDALQLREWRKTRRINQTDLGAILGVSHATISNWENDIFAIPPYLHLALEAVNHRLSFSSRPVLPPPRVTRRFQPVPPQLRLR